MNVKKRCITALFIIKSALALPPVEIPTHLYNLYTLNGAMGVTSWYRDDSYTSDNPLMYLKEQIDANIELVAQKKVNYYGATDTWLYMAIEKYLPQMQGKEVGIIGSTVPWYESIAVYYGLHPTTIEYNKIISQDPRVKVMTVYEYENNPITFDILFSISSYEHDGLGRYGDPLDPIGDFKAMQKARNMLRDGGLLFLAVPVGQDHIFWNVHRVYGKIRFPLLIEGWELVDSFGFNPSDFEKHERGGHQPIFVLRKK